MFLASEFLQTVHGKRSRGVPRTSYGIPSHLSVPFLLLPPLHASISSLKDFPFHGSEQDVPKFSLSSKKERKREKKVQVKVSQLFRLG